MPGPIQGTIESSERLNSRADEMINNFKRWADITKEEKLTIAQNYDEMMERFSGYVKYLQKAQTDMRSGKIQYSSSVIAEGERMAAAYIDKAVAGLISKKKELDEAAKPYKKEMEQAKKEDEAKKQAEQNAKYEAEIKTLEDKALPIIAETFKKLVGEKDFKAQYTAPLEKIMKGKSLSLKASELSGFCKKMQVVISMLAHYEKGDNAQAEAAFEGKTTDGVLSLPRLSIRKTLDAIEFKNKQEFLNFMKRRDQEKTGATSSTSGPSFE